MKEFIEIPANKHSISCRKLLFGVGKNDATYFTQYKGLKCPFYTAWTNMLNRCYNSKYQKDKPTYKNCVVTRKWLTFSEFKNWMETQDWKGKCLDKDVLNPGNHIYSPDYCIFASIHVNSLLTDHRGARGDYPQGVCFNRSKNKLEAWLSIDGKQIHLGSFQSVEMASSAYNNAKAEEIRRIANKQADFRIKNGLLRHAKLRLNS